MRKVYVAMDIGCLECGESSDLLGIFTRKEEAEQVLEIAKKKQEDDWHGEHSFELFEYVEEVPGNE